MELHLDGRKALVTGSTRGIGRATAEALLREGAEVVVNGRSDETVDEAVNELAERGPVHGAPGDLGTPDGVEAVIEAATADGPVDILVNNVGIFEPAPFAQIDDESWMRHWAVNVMSGVRLTRRLLPGMKERGWGRVIFVSSESGVQIPEEMIQYGVTKTAQIGLARGIAETTKGAGDVTVNSVLPGPTASEGVNTFLEERAEQEGVSLEELEAQFFEEARPTSLLQRFAEPEEVAALITYLCSPVASATNGAAVRVDGGVVRSAF